MNKTPAQYIIDLQAQIDAVPSEQPRALAALERRLTAEKGQPTQETTAPRKRRLRIGDSV